MYLFHLLPVNSRGGIETSNVIEINSSKQKIQKLKESYIKDRSNNITKYIKEYQSGSVQIRLNARLRDEETCEKCNKGTPLITLSGEPYLQVHLIHRLADDGPDIPENVAAICHNCQMEAHYGPNPESFNLKILEVIKSKENAIDKSKL